MRAAFVLTLALSALAAFGCFRQVGTTKTEDVVASIPWPDQEHAVYNVLDRKHSDKLLGEQTLNIARKDGQYELTQHYAGKSPEGEEGTDDSSVLVDAQTLKPISGTRQRVVAKNTQKLESSYDAAKKVVTITEIQDDKRLPSPRRLGNNYYDNDSSLFLWRALAFQEGYQAAYRTVVTGSGEQPVVQLEVVGKEQVTVPAGTFTAWRLEVRTESVKQVAWYADTPARPLIKYDNTILIFEATSLQ